MLVGRLDRVIRELSGYEFVTYEEYRAELDKE